MSCFFSLQVHFWQVKLTRNFILGFRGRKPVLVKSCCCNVFNRKWIWIEWNFLLENKSKEQTKFIDVLQIVSIKTSPSSPLSNYHLCLCTFSILKFSLSREQPYFICPWKTFCSEISSFAWFSQLSQYFRGTFSRPTPPFHALMPLSFMLNPKNAFNLKLIKGDFPLQYKKISAKYNKLDIGWLSPNVVNIKAWLKPM